MALLVTDHIANAYQALRRNRGRTLLTVLGIAIGIASITCILAISGGVQKMIGKQISDVDGHLAVIRPGQQTRDPNALLSPVAQQTFSTSSLTEADIAAVAAVPGVSAAVPLMTIDGTLKNDQTTIANNVVLATTPDFDSVANFTMKSGQFLDEVTNNNTAVIGEDLSNELFNTDRPIGQVFTMRGVEFTVVGVIKRQDNPINFNNINLNQAVVVSFERGQLFHQGRAQIQQIDVLVDESAAVADVTAKVNAALLATHLGEKDFIVATGDQITQPTNKLFSAITDVMTTIAAISLFVGGIGIMNIMLVGVAERTREIGIRKAVGASHGTILSQFVIESLAMSLLGGFVGYLLGILVAFGVSIFLYFTPAITWQTALAALAMAIAVGVLFGIYPAIKAARKNTIESLRQYH